MLRPRRVLEIGTYTGYATLCMAEGLEEGALIHTLEINDEMEDFIMKYLKQSPHQDKIRVHFGDALDIIPALGETFDLVFIDADKRLYSEYFDLVFPMVRAGGLILPTTRCGTVMWWRSILRINKHSVFLVLMIKSKKTRVLKKLSYLLRDGLTMIWKIKKQEIMESTRLSKIERLLQKELSDIFSETDTGYAWYPDLCQCGTCKPRFECGTCLPEYLPVRQVEGNA